MPDALDRLTDFMVEGILSMSDEEIMAECGFEDGMTDQEIKERADRLRKLVRDIADGEVSEPTTPAT